MHRRLYSLCEAILSARFPSLQKIELRSMMSCDDDAKAKTEYEDRIRSSVGQGMECFCAEVNTMVDITSSIAEDMIIQAESLPRRR